MTLKWHHIHTISKIHNCYVLNFQLASGMWHVLKDLSQSIHKATNPAVNLFEYLPSYLHLSHLHELKIPAPCILQIKNFSQNMLLSATTIEEVCCLFNVAQAIGIEMVEWIVEAKKHCRLLRGSRSWKWNGEDSVDSNRFPLLEVNYLFQL
jgi:hypothetical protein